jgi:undecaprenyl-diphosphatase
VTHLSALLLGALQGLTEFLPISSDGHLVLVGSFLDGALEGRSALGFDILLHAGSLAALLLVDRRMWWRLLTSVFRGDRDGLRLLGLIILATIPAGIAGMFLEDLIADRLRSPTAAGLGFLVTAIMLISGEQIGKRAKGGIDKVDWARAFLLGCVQSVAILPGVSRSASTASFGRVFGLDRRAAIDFSFLMAVPVIGGAIAKTVVDALRGSVVFPELSVSLAGLAAAFGVSLFAILLLRRLVSRYSLAWFAWYLIPLGLCAIAYDWRVLELVDETHLALYVRRFGALAIFPFSFMESVPPISFFSPGIILLTIAGSLARDPLTGILFFITAVGGSVAGNMLMYVLGHRYGRSIAHRFHLTEERLHAADKFMKKFGRLSVFLAQFFGAARPTVSFIAGTTRMPRRQYYPAMIVSAAVWAGFYLIFGFAVRDHIVWAASAIFSVGFLALPVVAVVIAIRAARSRKGSRAIKVH